MDADIRSLTRCGERQKQSKYTLYHQILKADRLRFEATHDLRKQLYFLFFILRGTHNRWTRFNHVPFPQRGTILLPCVQVVETIPSSHWKDINGRWVAIKQTTPNSDKLDRICVCFMSSLEKTKQDVVTEFPMSMSSLEHSYVHSYMNLWIYTIMIKCNLSPGTRVLWTFGLGER